MLLQGVQYKEIVGRGEMGESPVESFGYPEPPDIYSRTQKVFECAWADRTTLAPVLLGESQRQIGQNGSPFISRLVPFSHEDWGIDWASLGLGPSGLRGQQSILWANRVEIYGNAVDQTRPAGKSRMKSVNDTAVYLNARLKCELVALPFNVLTDAEMSLAAFVDANNNPDEGSLQRYVTILPKAKGRFLGLGQAANGGFKYANFPVGNSLSQQPVQQAPGMIQGSWDLQIRHWRVPMQCVASALVNPLLIASGNQGVIDTSIGKVNNAKFAGQPIGSILYLGAEFIRYIDPFGIPTFDICHFFEYVSYAGGHNCVPALSANKIAYIEISTDGATYNPPNPAGVADPGGVHIYNSMDFKTLFRSP